MKCLFKKATGDIRRCSLWYKCVWLRRQVLMWSLKGSNGFYKNIRKSMISVLFGPWNSACGTTSEMPNGRQFNRSGSQFNKNGARKPVLKSSKLCKCATIHSTRHAILGSYSRAHLQTSTNPTLKPLKKQPHHKTSTVVALI